ncbi:hypothetical protein A2U01_0094460, partial [Trifolium medium]|nr:hypothetical protein [Trifolium medium]
MLLNVGVQNWFVSTARSRVILPEIAMLQGRDRQKVQAKEPDPPPKDVSTVWAQK